MENKNLCGYFGINDTDRFNAPIQTRKKELLARVEYPGINGNEDTIVGFYSKEHERRHVVQRRIIEDLLLEDPNAYFFFKQDIEKGKSDKLITGRICNKIFGKKHRKDFENLEKIMKETKTEEDVIKNAKELSTCVQLSYWSKYPGLQENFANNGRDMLSLVVGSIMGCVTAYTAVDAIHDGIQNMLNSSYTENMGYLMPAAFIAGGIFSALIAKDCFKVAEYGLQNNFSEKKLEDYTPKQRKYLAAFPSKDKHKKRIVKMKEFGLDIN